MASSSSSSTDPILDLKREVENYFKAEHKAICGIAGAGSVKFHSAQLAQYFKSIAEYTNANAKTSSTEQGDSITLKELASYIIERVSINRASFQFTADNMEQKNDFDEEPDEDQVVLAKWLCQLSKNMELYIEAIDECRGSVEELADATLDYLVECLEICKNVYFDCKNECIVASFVIKKYRRVIKMQASEIQSLLAQTFRKIRHDVGSRDSLHSSISSTYQAAVIKSDIERVSSKENIQKIYMNDFFDNVVEGISTSKSRSSTLSTSTSSHESRNQSMHRNNLSRRNSAVKIVKKNSLGDRLEKNGISLVGADCIVCAARLVGNGSSQSRNICTCPIIDEKNAQ